MNAYQEKLKAKRERYLVRAESASQEATNRFNSSNVKAVIGLQGEPIKIGHHSEGRHRRLLEKADKDMQKGCEAVDKAKYYENKAASVGKGGISSDDPDCIEKLKEKLANLQNLQERMKSANKAIKKNDDEALKALGYNEAQIISFKNPDFCGRIGYASYQLTNNNSNIKRIKDRIASLEKMAVAEDVEQEYDGFTYKEEDNRAQFVFPDKPSEEIRAILKNHSFKFSPSRGAWVRQLTGNGKFAAKMVIEKLKNAECQG